MEAPSTDLPAAHSMDTEWFAIDGLGHVAVFDSGEAGGVPEAHFEAWHSQSMWSDLLGEMLSLAPPGSVRFVADRVFERDEDPNDWSTLYTEPDGLAEAYTWEVAVLLELDAPRDPVLLADWLGTAHVLGCELPLVYSGECSTQTLAAVWEEIGVVRAVLNPPMAPARFGVFSYSSEDYSGGPYRRGAKPMGAALRVEALATGLRRRLENVRLANVDFRREGRVQPFEHLPSTIWGTTWIGTDGSVHDVD
jgi:hypothetical protein